MRKAIQNCWTCYSRLVELSKYIVSQEYLAPTIATMAKRLKLKYDNTSRGIIIQYSWRIIHVVATVLFAKRYTNVV
jgi:hypothetical protein